MHALNAYKQTSYFAMIQSARLRFLAFLDLLNSLTPESIKAGIKLVFSVICLDKYWNVFHSCCDVAGKQPFSGCELEGFLKDCLIYCECATNNASIIGSWKCAHEVCVQLLKSICVKVSDPLSRNTTTQPVLSSLTNSRNLNSNLLILKL